MDLGLKELAEKQAEFCRIFGNTSRILIMWNLADQELSVSEISSRVGISMQNTSQHLSLLKEYHLVASRRDGQTIFYRIANSEWLKHCPILLKAFEQDLPV
jgi:DNA-binding transcriptional ArsR family regulator